MGQTLTCYRKHENPTAVKSGGYRIGMGQDDITDAVLAATKKIIENNEGLFNVVSLTFACEDLPKLNTFNNAGGMVVLYQKSGNQWVKQGQTEVSMATLNPKWVKSF